VFGYAPAELTGRRLTRLLGRESGARLADALRAVAGRPYGSTVLELTVPHRERGPRQAEITVTNLLSDTNVAGLVLNARDITERRQLQEQLVHEASHDALTQLANRALFAHRVREALRGREGVAVIFLDLDGFKEINDSLGHAVGDQLLVGVSDRLRADLREGDTIARLGGDEFAVLLRSADVAAAHVVARRIVELMRTPFPVAGRDLHVRASVGIATGPGGATARGAESRAEQLLRNADLAMYRAKAAGGGDVAGYDPQMHSGLMDRLQLETDLRRALEHREMLLHYQPTVDLRDGSVVGFEALLRWEHPVRGMVPPTEFIGVAESTGLIVPLGRWVLTEACHQAAAWSAAAGRPVKIAVNMSVRQFDRADLAAVVAQVLAETGLPAGQLCLEMTESVLMTDTEENLAQLLRLKDLGVQIAIDDFGTGYSSLAYLRRFPVDIIKIDRSFVEQVDTDSGDVALVDAVVGLGQALNMQTVAEGVETDGQWLKLRQIGCDHGQGYLFGRPADPAEVTRLLTAVPARP
jgi:diguanylate cyclase (GGDEF)-like protein/PAS domain S-box-containing protein